MREGKIRHCLERENERERSSFEWKVNFLRLSGKEGDRRGRVPAKTEQKVE